MNEIERLRAAIRTGTANDVAHALIYFEKQNPTIDASVKNALSQTLEKESAADRAWKGYDVKVQKAVLTRKARLGGGLWFSTY